MSRWAMTRRAGRSGDGSTTRRAYARGRRSAAGLRRLGGGGEVGPELAQGQAQAALRRPERHGAVPGDLVRGQPAPVGEQDGLALGLGQLADGGGDLRALGPAERGLDRGLVRAALVAGDDDAQAVSGPAGGLALAEQVDGPRTGHEAQVRADLPAAGVVALGMAPEAQEHVLGDVLGLRGVAEHALGHGVDAAVVLGVDALELGGIGEVHGVTTLYTRTSTRC